MINKYINSDIYRGKSHQLIPGGCHTYSKGDDQFPEVSPAAIKKGEGAYVWDIDGNKFLDCSMGLTSVSLGHGDRDVANRVYEEICNGVNFQRPSYLEVEVAEKFLNLVPGHEMIKFTKNGSAATTAAVKIARAYTGRKYVVFPKDMPFFSYDDWFISSTPCNIGVPSEVAELSLTFLSTDLSTLEELFEKYPDQIACVISEPDRSSGVIKDYADSLIKICHENGALFIQDEMVTGFKAGFPGSINNNKLTPDIATWGKGIANGFSFCALTGTTEVMKLGGIDRVGEKKLFLLSTTHGGETGALAAASATIDKFIDHSVVNHNHRIGKLFLDRVKEIISELNLIDNITVADCPWMVPFTFKNMDGEVDNGFRTLFLQEMIKNGILFQGVFVPCFSHCEEDVDKFMNAFKESCLIFKRALSTDWKEYLVGEPTKPVFREII